MTPVDVVFRYGMVPGEPELRAINSARDVYGIRKISFNEKEKTVRVEYDATRLNQQTVGALLRGAGIDLEEKLQLA